MLQIVKKIDFEERLLRIFRRFEPLRLPPLLLSGIVIHEREICLPKHLLHVITIPLELDKIMLLGILHLIKTFILVWDLLFWFLHHDYLRLENPYVRFFFAVFLNGHILQMINQSAYLIGIFSLEFSFRYIWRNVLLKSGMILAFESLGMVLPSFEIELLDG